MRDYLNESQKWLGSPRPLKVMLAEDPSALLSTLVKYLSHSDIYKRKYAAFCLGQIGDDIVLPALQTAFTREPDGGGKEAMGAALATIKKMPAKSGSTEEQRCTYQDEIYQKGIPEWVTQVAGGPMPTDEEPSSPEDALLEEAYVAYFSREWQQVHKICEKLVNSRSVSQVVAAASRKLMAESLLGMSISGDDSTKQRLRSAAIEISKESIAMYGINADPVALSEAWRVHGSALSMFCNSIEATIYGIKRKAALNDQAMAAYQRALQINPKNDDAQKHLEKCREKGREYAEALVKPKGFFGRLFS